MNPLLHAVNLTSGYGESMVVRTQLLAGLKLVLN